MSKLAAAYLDEDSVLTVPLGININDAIVCLVGDKATESFTLTELNMLRPLTYGELFERYTELVSNSSYPTKMTTTLNLYFSYGSAIN